MKRLYLYLIIVSIVVSGWLILLSSVTVTHAAPHATYGLLQSYSGPGGGGSAGIYDLASSIGQPATGEVGAGNYTLGSGFWGGGVLAAVQSNHTVYLPLILR